MTLHLATAQLGEQTGQASNNQRTKLSGQQLQRCCHVAFILGERHAGRLSSIVIVRVLVTRDEQASTCV